MGKDFWDEMFDFNGDGKTTWDEEMLGLSLLEQDRKRTAKNLESKLTYKYKSMPTIKAVPEVVDESNYKSFCREYRAEFICALGAIVLLLLPAITILLVAYSAYDPQNSDSDFMMAFFTIAGLVYGGFVLRAPFKSMITGIKYLKLVKERYTESKLPKK